MAMSIFWTALFLKAEPLLACVLAGIMTTNRKQVSICQFITRSKAKWQNVHFKGLQLSC
jgi:hypothetical protein